jgi:polysulfide reductase-like protein
MTEYRGDTYYGRPALKPSHYGWLVVAYLVTGGLAGSAAIIGALGGDRRAGRSARLVALAAVAVAPLPLVKDLHVPRRWYNMLRIARPTSPMSIGSWTLATSGGVAALQVLADLLGARAMRRMLAFPAGVLGAVLSTYTGSLLAAAATPLWSTIPRLLPVLFGSSAMSTAAAAVELASGADLAELAIAATAAEAVSLEAVSASWREAGVAGAVEEPRIVAAHQAARSLAAASIGLNVVALVTGSKGARDLAAVAAIGSGIAMRALLVFGGQRSALRPTDYFGMKGDAARETMLSEEERRRRGLDEPRKSYAEKAP